MKKRILGILLAALIVLPSMAHAGVLEAVSKRLRDSSGTLITSFAIASAATVYTEAIPIQDNGGYMALLAVEDKSGGAGNLAISAEYSNDGTNFYTVYTTASGTLTADSAVVSSLANVTRYIQLTARLAKYVRFKLVAAANSQLTMDIIWARTR
jgi:hypothetical protein